MDVGSEEGKEEHALLTALPWGTQESGEIGQRGDVRARESDGGKGTSATADEGVTRSHHGAWRVQGEENGGRRGGGGAEPLGVEENSGVCEASGVDPEPHGVEWEEGGREASGVEENPGRGRHGVGGGSNCLRTNLLATERAGGRVVPG